MKIEIKKMKKSRNETKLKIEIDENVTPVLLFLLFIKCKIE